MRGGAEAERGGGGEGQRSADGGGKKEESGGGGEGRRSGEGWKEEEYPYPQANPEPWSLTPESES